MVSPQIENHMKKSMQNGILKAIWMLNVYVYLPSNWAKIASLL